MGNQLLLTDGRQQENCQRALIAPPLGGIVLLTTADHDHGYMVPDMVPGRDYERCVRLARASHGVSEQVEWSYWEGVLGCILSSLLDWAGEVFTIHPRPPQANRWTRDKSMGSTSKQTETEPATDRQPMCNADILRLLADHQGRSVSDMAVHFRVTLTAIRNRLIRLTQLQSVTRQRKDERRRGRPKYLYYITSRGEAALAETVDEGTA